jgi:hypothetical protein
LLTFEQRTALWREVLTALLIDFFVYCPS